ncbi:MAG: helicase C-terminal domain-containing protein [Opitutaceae bacterium]|jgi:ATP-dependent DNA helicase DinG
MIGLHDETGVPPKPQRARALAAAAFGEAGWLHGGMDLEYRPEQDQMARAVAAAFTEDASLLFEAGTGVGKSLAYLVPGIIHAIDSGRPLIVSTNTISLQEQLETKDLPLCRSLFSSVPELEAYARFRAAVLLGKSNYLCTSRLANALAERASLFDDEEYAELQRIAAWSEATESGLRHEMQPPPRAGVWEAVNADSSSCSRRHCDPSRCFYQRARSRLRAANLIIVNHALLFALINAGGAKAEGASAEGRGVLFPDDFLVLDEAHTIPEVATDHFGIALSSYGVDRSLKVLYNPRTKRGLLRKRGGPEAQRLVGEALDCAKKFFGLVEAKLLAARPVARQRDAGMMDPILDGPLDSLQRLVARISDQLEDGRERDELLDQKGRLKAIQASAGEWLNLSDPEHVYWAERSGRRETIVTLRSAPIDVAPELRRRLFGCGVGVVCTSATLALAGEMAPFASRMGADGARTGLVHSPFDFERNMRVYVAADVPPPSPQEARLSLDALADYISFCALRVTGGSLVLFTSHSDLQAVAAALEPEFARAGRSLLLQGEGASRTELARQMRSQGNAILFGTDSFWTGVDVPGDALAQVIITRLPFDPPDHPVVEARADRIRENGGSPFNEITLPEALVKFRQGAGRLIRSKTDRGLITILDSRILSKSYGRLFIESLPKQDFHRLTRENREELFLPFSPG